MNPTREQLEDLLMTVLDDKNEANALMRRATGGTQKVLTRIVDSLNHVASDIQDIIDDLPVFDGEGS